MIGKQLGNRYELLVKIGEGGMANVYSARDSLLNRTVTVKVLKDYLVSDQDFVRRFRKEAQAAAALSHPNIINIYDVGEEDDIHYIVMEYVQGKTLKEVIRENGRIPVEDAVEILRQITEAINHAHSNQVIHRDIKPQNIMVSRNGQAKVMDFGIAIAVNAATVTNDEQVMGSVHYFSPEQAKGNFTGEQSDIYSLGIVFYEMLTGKLPYSGETPVTIALKHLNEDIEPPSDLYDDIPEPLERMIFKAVQKDLSKRYANARELLDDIKLWQETKRVNAVIPEGESDEEENTMVMEPVKAATNVGKVTYKGGKSRSNPRKKTNRRIAIALLAVLLGALLVGGYFLFRHVVTVPEVTVPDLVGMSLEEADEELSGLGLEYRDSFEYDNEVPQDHIISQDPEGGTEVRKNREILLKVSQGRRSIEVPDVVGLPRREAAMYLNRHDLDYEMEEEYSEEVDSGYVIRQDPRAGVQIYEGEEVVVYISKGIRSFPIRDLTGKNEVEVKIYLEEEGLILNQEQEEYSDKPEGKVIDQHPSPDTEVQPGDPVDITWSKGPEDEEEEEEDEDDDEEEEEETEEEPGDEADEEESTDEEEG